MAGRKPLAPAEQRGPDFVGATPADMAEQEARARNAVALATSQQESTVRAVAQQLGYQLPADCTDPDLIQRDIAANMRRSVEACLQVGMGLTVLKSACQHGEFLARLDVLGIEVTVAQRFMHAARKFSNAATSRLLGAAGNQSKLLEMLVLDDEQIEELELTGQTGELSLDDVATMSVKELRAALRQAKQDNAYANEQRVKERERADKAEKKLAGKRPVVVPLDERLDPFLQEISERQKLLVKGIAAHHEAAKALDTWWTDEVTQAEGYDPEAPAPLPRSVALVALTLQDSINSLAELLGAAQHAFEERFGDDLAEARQYLMQTPEAADAAA
jgi:hypothetical protein